MDENYEAEKDIKQIFESFIELIKIKNWKKIPNITIYFNNDNLASGFVKKGILDENTYLNQCINLGKDIKPKITLMVSDSQMTIAHHPSKLVSIFVQNNNINKKSWEGWEEIW